MTTDKLGNITLYNADCMDLLRDMPDNAYDLAIVDPPYGDGKTENGGGYWERFGQRFDRYKKTVQHPTTHGKICTIPTNTPPPNVMKNNQLVEQEELGRRSTPKKS